MSDLNFRTLDLNLLRVFDEVMAERSLTRAAHNLALTQPAVSNALRRLRETLGDDLLRRSGQNLVPTERAITLWPSVRDALRTLQASLAPERFNPAQAKQAFTLLMADTTAVELLPGLEPLLVEHAPDVSILSIPLTTRDPRRLLQDDEADIALGYFPTVLAELATQAQVGKRVSFMHQRLYGGEYMCAMRKNHPLAKLKRALTLDEYCSARHVLVNFSGKQLGFTDAALAELGRTRHVAMTVNQFSTAAQVVVKSDMLTVLPRHFAKVVGLGVGEQILMVPMPVRLPPVQVDALWHQRLNDSASHQWLREQLQISAERTLGKGIQIESS